MAIIFKLDMIVDKGCLWQQRYSQFWGMGHLRPRSEKSTGGLNPTGQLRAK
jgi:hypothetical protein